MRIWIEASLIARHGGGGSRRYAERLAAGLAAAGEDVTVIANEGAGAFGVPVAPLRVAPRALHALWSVTSWPSLTSVVNGPPPDIVHAAEKVSVPPVARPTPLAVTVHDVFCLTSPRLCPGKLRWLVARSWRTRDRWDLVLTGLESVRNELAGLGFPPERVAVVPYGVDDAFLARPEDGDELRGRLGLPDPNVVFVGPLTRKKGGDVLLGAIGRLRRRGSPVSLVVRGPEDLSEVAMAVGSAMLDEVRPAIRFLPPLADADLARLYAQADAVVCPSRAEGYHFPLVEGLSVGATVVASDIPAFREAARGAALLVAPGDPEALSVGLERALAGERGPGGFEPPRWADTAAGTIRAYRELLARG